MPRKTVDAPNKKDGTYSERQQRAKLAQEARERIRNEYKNNHVETGSNLLPFRMYEEGEGYTKEIALSVVMMVADGDTVNAACRKHGMNPSVYRSWVLKDHDGLSKLNEQARQMQAEAWADDSMEIADAWLDPSDEGAQAEVAYRKLRIGTRNWLMERNHVARFGNQNNKKGDVNVSVRVSMAEIKAAATPKEAQERYLEMMRSGDPLLLEGDT